MRSFHLLLLGCLALTASPGCEEIDSPKGPVPEPVLVPFTDLPQPLSEATYRLSGPALSDGPVAVLETLVHARFHVVRAWYPEITLCGAVFADELIVELAAPNGDILDLGFSRDFSGTSGPCTSYWDEYRFTG